jgi:hypothetical protein
VSLGSEIGVICQGGQADIDVGNSDIDVGDSDMDVGDPEMAGTLEVHHNAQLELRPPSCYLHIHSTVIPLMKTEAVISLTCQTFADGFWRSPMFAL